MNNRPDDDDKTKPHSYDKSKKSKTSVVEFWFDGGWTKENYRWPLNDIYQTIKSRVPECQIGVNWSIGLPENIDYHAVYPEDQKEGYPIRYFPSDFCYMDGCA